MAIIKSVSSTYEEEQKRKKYNISATRAYKLGLKACVSEARGETIENNQALREKCEKLAQLLNEAQQTIEIYRRIRGEVHK